MPQMPSGNFFISLKDNYWLDEWRFSVQRPGDLLVLVQHPEVSEEVIVASSPGHSSPLW